MFLANFDKIGLYLAFLPKLLNHMIIFSYVIFHTIGITKQRDNQPVSINFNILNN